MITGGERASRGRSPRRRPICRHHRRTGFWSRHRASIGTATTGCLPRITSSGPPSRRWTKGNIAKRGEATHDGHARDGPVAAGCCDTRAKPHSHDTSRSAWAKLRARVGEWDFLRIDSAVCAMPANRSWPRFGLRSVAQRCVGSRSTRISQSRVWWRDASSCHRGLTDSSQSVPSFTATGELADADQGHPPPLGMTDAAPPRWEEERVGLTPFNPMR